MRLNRIQRLLSDKPRQKLAYLPVSDNRVNRGIRIASRIGRESFGFELLKSLRISARAIDDASRNSWPAIDLRPLPRHGFWLCPRPFVTTRPTCVSAMLEPHSRPNRLTALRRGETVRAAQ